MNLENFHEKVLYRTLEILGRNKEEILSDILDNLFSVYSFEETDINLDWTSIVLHGTKSKLGKYGYSRDHRPDKLQITVGVSELKKPINVPIGITVNKGNVLDLQHFHETYNQVKSRLKRGSLIVFDKGANTIDNKKLPKKFRINNELIVIDYSFRTKLEELSDEEAIELLKSSIINGREGFFCLKSNKNLTLEKALEIYRDKDSIEKIFNSLKNEIQIKPLRIWSDNSIYGAILLGFIAQLFISHQRYEFEEVKHRSTKFIKKSLKNLTLTIKFAKKGLRNYIFANFDGINSSIVTKMGTIP